MNLVPIENYQFFYNSDGNYYFKIKVTLHFLTCRTILSAVECLGKFRKYRS